MSEPQIEIKPGCVGATILTRSGSYFDFENPESSDIFPTDLAHALSQMCRYTGHTTHFYSIAQHCVLTSYVVPPEHAFAGLMHDAHEAYVGDMSSPLKQLCPDYRAIEKRVEAAVAARFGLSTPWHPEIKRADLIMLLTEKRDLTVGASHRWPMLDGLEPREQRITPLPADAAKLLWLARFDELYHG